MRPNPLESADLVTFTEEIVHGKLSFNLLMHNVPKCSDTI